LVILYPLFCPFVNANNGKTTIFLRKYFTFFGFSIPKQKNHQKFSKSGKIFSQKNPP